ncbi:MAG: FAD-dependent oxidoreductase [Candidatus Thermoplasmatota archaeon]|nr:FAD-dependent oxidoreductase [Candidatus Thermoplasmatota archaeon]
MSIGAYDLAVIGGGAAGLAGAAAADKQGLNVLVIEAGSRLGGIPLQCIHPGFGLSYFNEDLTGPEFAERLVTRVQKRDIDILTDAHVTSLELLSDGWKKSIVITRDGIQEITATGILYAAGARERHRHETGIVGDRPAGVLTAGEAQTLMDIDGALPGRHVVIIGSGDIGLVMARRLALEGATVEAVIEMLPYPGGLTRNVIQCLHDFDIPLHTGRMVTAIRGDRRVEAVDTVAVDDSMQPVDGTRQRFPCDTVALATGLIPNTSRLQDLDIAIDPATGGPVVNDCLETSIPGVFAAGNALAINDYVDDAARQGEHAAAGAALYLEHGQIPADTWTPIQKGRNIRLILPHQVSGQRPVTIYARVQKPMPHAVVRLPELDIELPAQGVTPGEMLTIDIEADRLAGHTGPLTLEVTR